MTDEGYLFEMQRLAFEMEQVADKYGVKDRTINVIITGLIDESATGLQKIKAIYSYNIDDVNELDEMQEFIYHTYHEPGKEELDQRDLNDLLGGTGIELED